MSTSGSQHGRATMRSSGPSRGGGSVYSVGQTLRKNRNTLREEMIAKKITEIFKEKDQKMIRTIDQTITEDRLRVYKTKRQFYEDEFAELDAERKRIIKKKKSKKEKAKQLKGNTRSIFQFVVKSLNATVLHYKEQYYENDYYRYKKLVDVQNNEQLDEKQKSRGVIDQLITFFNSPFKEDRRFTIFHLAQMTRDRVEQSKDLVNHLFFDKIFNMLLKTTDEKNMLKAFEILCNLIQSTSHRKRLANQGYFKTVYETMRIGQIEEKTLERLSWMTTLICFHPDMIEQIINLKLLSFIIKLVDTKFSPAIRSNAVLAISLLTYHESLFDELISNGVIDLVMNLCMDVGGDLTVKQFSTLALVHFALSKQSINILIQKGIMDLFNSLGNIKNVQIQTNVSWIFLALCNNGITGAQMLSNGITRDMFLVSCNPQFHQIRHLVIAGFAELGRCTDLRDTSSRQKGGSLQRVKEKAIVGMDSAFKQDAQLTIEILLQFTVSDELKFIITAFWALKDYILLNHECLIPDLSGVICAFQNGSAQESEKVKIECADAISFLITHHLVFQDGTDKRPEVKYVLDSLMLLTGSESLQVRTRAFSTLSTLSTYASQSEEIMQQIQAEITMPQGQISRQYFNFITQRLSQSVEAFKAQYKTEGIETRYAGLYCLLRLVQEPSEQTAQEVATYLHQFYFPEHYEGQQHSQFIDQSQNQFQIISYEMKVRLSVNLKNDNLDTRDITLEPLNEKFFMFVFESLLYTKNQQILYQLLDVVNFYIKHETPFQPKVIHASIILWMLKILVKYRSDPDLSLLAAKTILKVVDSHQIIFDYQEMAIINKFNRALDNFDGVCDQSNSSDEDTASEGEQTQVQNSEDELATMRLKVQAQLNSEIGLELRKQQFQLFENGLSEKISENGQLSELEEQIRQAQSELGFDYSEEPGWGQTNAKVANKTISCDQSEFEKCSLPQISLTQTEREFDDGQQISKIDHAQDSVELDTSGLLAVKKTPDITQSDINAPSELKLIPQKQTNQNNLLIHEFEAELDSIPSVQSPLSPASPQTAKFQITQSETVREHDSQRNETKIKRSQSFQTAKPGQDIALRDALIKSFMVIFTNEKSQHLLLNKDIIEIAFSCLNQCDQISMDAKRNLARLISIIFKFPQVQDRILEEQVINGVVHLLTQAPDQKQIMSHAVRSCTYISLSYKFINSSISINLLKALTPLMDRLELPSEVNQNHELQRPEYKSDNENCLFAISNLLKGSSQNCQFFIESDGPRRVMSQMLKLLSQSPTPERTYIIELCASSIKQLSYRKENFKQFLAFSEVNRTLLTKCLKLCFNLSNDWYKNTSELMRYKKVINQINQPKKPEIKRHDTNLIMNLNYQNVENFKAKEILESQNDLSIKMSPEVKIRNSVYFTVVGCFKAQFQCDFLLKECDLINCLMTDLQRHDLNDYIFQHMILCLQALQKKQTTIVQLMKDHSKKIFGLVELMKDKDKKITLLKTVIQLVIKIPEQICDLDLEIFGKLFRFAVEFEDQNDTNDIKECVLWLQTTILELNESESQQEKAIQACMQFGTAGIFISQLTNPNERILLQAIKGLSVMASLPDFRPTMLIDYGDKMFSLLAEIAFRKAQGFKNLGLNIEVAICQVVSLITSSKNQKDPLTVAARRKVVTLGFVDYFLQRSCDFEYKVQEETEELEDIASMQQQVEQSNTTIFDIDQSKLISVNTTLEEVDRNVNTNLLVEETMFLVSNVTELAENHYSLVKNAGKLLVYLVKIAQKLFQAAQDNGLDSVEMLNLTFGNLKMGQYISMILHNLCSIKNHQEQRIDVQEVCLKSGFGLLIIQLSQTLVDYEMHVNLFKAMESLVLSKNPGVVRNAVEQGCFQEILVAADESRFFKVRRLCQSVVEQATESLHAQNQTYLKAQAKNSKKQQ